MIYSTFAMTNLTLLSRTMHKNIPTLRLYVKCEVIAHAGRVIASLFDTVCVELVEDIRDTRVESCQNKKRNISSFFRTVILILNFFISKEGRF